jgi:hypothetical protein
MRLQGHPDGDLFSSAQSPHRVLVADGDGVVRGDNERADRRIIGEDWGVLGNHPRTTARDTTTGSHAYVAAANHSSASPGCPHKQLSVLTPAHRSRYL